MPKYYDEIPHSLIKWCLEQKVFWVATSPLGEDGLINLSPKGVDGSFRVASPNRVWYEDLTGSGVETIAHVRENGRITVLFNAFDGPPRILRLYGKGTVYEFGTPEYEELLPPGKRQTGSRAIIMIDVFKVATSCGFGVPFYDYRGPRTKLVRVAKMFENGQTDGGKNLKGYWETQNAVSLDGLPALTTAFEAKMGFVKPEGQPEQIPEDDEKVHDQPAAAATATGTKDGGGREGEGMGIRQEDLKVVLAFFAGAVVATSYLGFFRGFLSR